MYGEKTTEVFELVYVLQWLAIVGNAGSNRASRHGKARRENGILGRSKKGMAGRRGFAKANGEFSVEGVTGMIVAI